MALTTNSIRNIAICGHGETGKTTLLEQILYNAKVISKAETVESGRTVSDFTEEEIERKISIHSTLSNIMWKDTKINIANRALRLLDIFLTFFTAGIFLFLFLLFLLIII